MKRRIEQLLNGIFEYEQGKLVIRPEELTLKGAPQEVLHGKFFAEGAAGQKVHGFLYPSDVRMICEPAEFHGASNEIHYQFDCSGLRQGTSVSGKIFICCDCGEYEVPYTVNIAAGSVGRELPFSDLDGFADLARTDAEMACRAFWTTEFQTLLEDRPELFSLYEGVTVPAAEYHEENSTGNRSVLMRHAMEEFLIGAGLKDAVTLTIDGPKEGMQSFAAAEEAPPRDGSAASCSRDPENAARYETAYEWRCDEIREPMRETLRLHKSTWGFLEISVESDALFVRPERKFFTTEDFAGSSFDLHLILDANLMHAGNNYARLTLRAGRQTLQVLVSAKKPGRAGNRQSHIRKIMIKKLENNYISFRLKKMDLETWIERSVSVINSYKRAGGDDPFADLFLVQLYFADDKKNRAAKLLEQIEAQKDRLDTPERYCFYLYISTFIYREASYVDRVEEEVTAQYYRSRSSWPLMWILLYLQEKYLNDPDARYEAVAEQFRSGGSAASPGAGGRIQPRSGERFALSGCGCRSRIMYVEAYQVLRGNPFLLRHLGEFELHLLCFADQEKVLTAEILRQVANLSMHQTQFDRRLFDVLSHGYQVYPSEDLLRAICQILLRGQKTDPVYFQWYALGVESGLRMNGLYEAYMQTMDCTDFQELPQIIRMYFPYDTSLDYRRRAALYRSIADARKSDPQPWLNHRPAMERFVMEQIELGHITDDLAALYLELLKEPMLTDSLAKKLIRLYFTCEVTSDLPGRKQIVLHSGRMTREITAGLSDGIGQIRICDSDSAVFLTDEKGQRYAAGDSCRIRRILDMDALSAPLRSALNDRPLDDQRPRCASAADRSHDAENAARCAAADQRLLAWCAKKAPEDANLVVYLTAECRKDQIMNEQLLPYFMAGCELAGISDGFRAALRKQMLSWYMEHPMDDTLPDFLDRIAYDDYIQVGKTALITLLAEESRCTEAFELLNRYGAEEIPLLQMVRICSRMVLELEFEENVMLLSLCHECFEKGKYDDKLLRYLLLYYEGPVGKMKLVWSAACEFGLDAMLLEEKILMMMLFTRQGTEGSEPIFESYRKKLGRKKLCRAYVNLKSYEYFVKGLPVAEPVFAFIENEYRRFSGTDRLTEQEEVCRLALLQYYARSVSLSKTQRVYASEMLEEFMTKGKRFAFYLRFDEELLRPWQLDGHVFAEYAGSPESTVFIEYRIRRQGEAAEAPFTREPVPDCFEGIFVREFTLFADEEIECRFIEEPSGGKEASSSRLWILKANQEENRPGMYGLLNRLCRQVSDKDESGAMETLDSWLTLEYLAKEVFTLV
ncbi:MAG: DUF5717 family protein [Lachnospiraceae bacterium]|nr:DUF5717 family protein [Lachnospiraceae bacterium]